MIKTGKVYSLQKDGLGRVSATHGGPYDVQSITGYDPENDVM